MPLAELRCGAATATLVERVRQLIGGDGGTVALARVPDGGETVTLRLPAAGGASQAA